MEFSFGLNMGCLISSNDKTYRNQIQDRICKVTDSIAISKIGKILIIFKEEFS